MKKNEGLDNFRWSKSDKASRNLEEEKVVYWNREKANKTEFTMAGKKLNEQHWSTTLATFISLIRCLGSFKEREEKMSSEWSSTYKMS